MHPRNAARALVRGYDTLLVSDAHTTEDNTAYGSPQPELVIKHVNFYLSYSLAGDDAAALMPSGRLCRVGLGYARSSLLSAI